jgi:fatty acid desaturase
VITDAAPSFSDEQHRRTRRYTILMAVHLATFALAGVLYYYAWWLGLVLLVVTTPLPWVAVVLANSPSRPFRRASPAVDGARLLRLGHRCLPRAAVRRRGTRG